MRKLRPHDIHYVIVNDIRTGKEVDYFLDHILRKHGFVNIFAIWGVILEKELE